jgi:PAS domain S-box-containing protein
MVTKQLPSSFQFEAIFNEAAIGILVTNASFEILISNYFADRLFGFEHHELIGKNISILIPNHLKDRHHDHLSHLNSSAISRPMGIGLDLKAKRKDESLFPIEISLSHFKENEQIFYIAFVSDVTLKRQVELELILKNQEVNQLNETLEEEVKTRTQALQNTLEKLEKNTQELEISLQKEIELGDLKTRFVSMASHEFRTPLTAILSSATLIEKYQQETDQEKRLNHINRIKSSVSNLTEILEEFLSVGNLEDGKIELNLSTIPLSLFFENVVTELSAFRKGNQQIILEFEGLPTFHSDSSILRKILLNGLSNALKFSNKNVILRLQATEEFIEINIIDEGVGISQEDQKHLFERFFRGGNVNVIQGTGLGLHLIDRYLELLGGEIKITSELNKGTNLYFKIPTKNNNND